MQTLVLEYMEKQAKGGNQAVTFADLVQLVAELEAAVNAEATTDPAPAPAQ